MLANQTLGQLHGRTSRALIDLVLNNVSTLLSFRIGIRDAELLAPWFYPHMTVDDLIAMPNFRAAGRMLQDEGPVATQLLELLPLPPIGDRTVEYAIVASSRARYCRAHNQVEADVGKERLDPFS